MLKMNLIIAAICLGVQAYAGWVEAKTFYYVNGKLVETVGQAKKAALKDPKAVVYKIQATQVAMNDETLNLKKSKDVELEQLKTIIK